MYQFLIDTLPAIVSWHQAGGYSLAGADTRPFIDGWLNERFSK